MRTPDVRTSGVAAHSAAHPRSSCAAVRWRASDAAADRALTRRRSSAHERATARLASESLHARVPMSAAQLVCAQVADAAPDRPTAQRPCQKHFAIPVARECLVFYYNSDREENINGHCFANTR